MNARLLVRLAILGSGPLVMLLAWPLVADQVLLADLTVAVVTQPHSEIVVTGYLKNNEAPAFSIESLSIEEPGKEPYRRLVSLDDKRRFELTLGQPVAGTYRIAAWTRTANWLNGPQEGWLHVPELVVKADGLPGPQRQRAQDFDYQRLLLFGTLTVAAQAACLIVWYRLPARARSTASG